MYSMTTCLGSRLEVSLLEEPEYSDSQHRAHSGIWVRFNFFFFFFFNKAQHKKIKEKINLAKLGIIQTFKAVSTSSTVIPTHVRCTNVSMKKKQEKEGLKYMLHTACL